MTKIRSAAGIFREVSWKSVTYQNTVFGDFFSVVSSSDTVYIETL